MRVGIAEKGGSVKRATIEMPRTSLKEVADGEQEGQGGESTMSVLYLDHIADVLNSVVYPLPELRHQEIEQDKDQNGGNHPVLERNF